MKDVPIFQLIQHFGLLDRLIELNMRYLKALALFRLFLTDLGAKFVMLQSQSIFMKWSKLKLGEETKTRPLPE